MRKIRCIKCNEERDEIEFEYIYFKHKYEKICKHCEDRFKKIFRNIKDENINISKI